MTTPTIEPTRIVAGDTIAWIKTLGDYSAANGWVLHYRFVNSSNYYDITASASGADHAVSVSAATSAEYASGEYTWTSWVTKASERHTVANGKITIAPNLAALTAGYDTRTHARKTLAAIETWIESKDLGVAEYEIAGRRMRYIPMGELLALRDKYRFYVQRETAAERAASGLAPKNKLFVRF